MWHVHWLTIQQPTSQISQLAHLGHKKHVHHVSRPYRVYPFPVVKVGARDFVVRGLLYRVIGAIYFLSPFAVLAVLSVYLEFLGAKWGFAG